MQAETGKTYALVQDGKVHQIFTIAELPEWHDALDVRDITGQHVEVGFIDVGGVLQAFVPPPKTPEQIQRDLEAALDRYIDSVAQAKGYDSRITATLRAGYPNPWQAEGIAFGEWMDACYAKAFEILTEVQNGTRAIPTEAEMLAEMPQMTWPT